MKVLKKIIIGILGIAFFSFAISITVLLLYYNKYGITEIGDTSVVIIKRGITSDNYKKGDVALVRKATISEINAGDEVFVYNVAEDGSVSIDLGIVEGTHPESRAITLENGAPYSMQYVMGRTYKVYEKVGTYLAIVESTWGFLAIILIPSLVIFIYEIYALIVEIKYGSDEA